MVLWKSDKILEIFQLNVEFHSLYMTKMYKLVKGVEWNGLEWFWSEHNFKHMKLSSGTKEISSGVGVDFYHSYPIKSN